VKTRTESDSSLIWVNLDITKSLVDIGGDDDVHRLDGTREGLIQILLGDLEFEKSAVDLVDNDNWLDTLTESLTKHSLGLHAHTFDSVDDDKSTVSDTKSCGNLGREIDVPGRVDKVDQEILALYFFPPIISATLFITTTFSGSN
jgi:hypothetical protein